MRTDLNDLATYGDNLADAFAMAGEACGQYLFNSLRDGDILPVPSAKESCFTIAKSLAAMQGFLLHISILPKNPRTTIPLSTYQFHLLQI